MKKISIFGSTGTIGRKALELASINNFEIVAISGNKNHDLLIEQAKLFNPKYVSVSDKNSFEIVKNSLSNNIDVVPESEIENIAQIDVDCCVMAISGNSGLIPTFQCLGHAKRLAIATKEVIISGGILLKNKASQLGTEIIPIDSEHNAIFQSIANENKDEVNKLILTASGGAFLDYEEKDLENVTLQDALRHPNWNMGKKITIDSATMINKALEIIEAAYLFDIQISKVDALIHPNSIIHGMVLFNDGTFKSIMSYPDMMLPISFAINYPVRKACFMKGIDFTEIENLNFRKPKDWQKKNINLAYQAFNEKKSITFNAANELAVQKFMDGSIKFLDIHKLIVKILEKSESENIDSIDDILDIISQTKHLSDF